jgi:hypothetical protein
MSEKLNSESSVVECINKVVKALETNGHRSEREAETSRGLTRVLHNIFLGSDGYEAATDAAQSVRLNDLPKLTKWLQPRDPRACKRLLKKAQKAQNSAGRNGVF